MIDDNKKQEALRELLGEPVTVNDLVKSYLEACGFDGLFHPETNCCCSVASHEMMACCEPQDMCFFGIERPCSDCHQKDR